MPNNMKAQELFEAALAKVKARIESGGDRLLSPAAVVDQAADEATVYLYDIIDAFWGIDAAQFIKDLNDLAVGTIHLRINSPGGSVFDAEAIQTALQQHKARVVAHIDGMAASAATYIALAADEVEMSDGGMFMIHNAWGCMCGNADEMLAYAAILEKIDANIVRDYLAKTGKSEEQIREWMASDTWFNAEEALENGFVDSIYTTKKEEEGEKHAKNNDEKQFFDMASRAFRERELMLIEIGR